MKNDPFFKLTAAVILAGVIAAFASPAPKLAAQTPLAPASVKAVAATPLAQAASRSLNFIASPAAGQNRTLLHAARKS